MTDAIRPANALGKRIGIEYVSAMENRTQLAQVIDDGLLSRGIRTIQARDGMPRFECALDEVSSNETCRTRHEYLHAVYPVLAARVCIAVAADLPPENDRVQRALPGTGSCDAVKSTNKRRAQPICRGMATPCKKRSVAGSETPSLFLAQRVVDIGCRNRRVPCRHADLIEFVHDGSSGIQYGHARPLVIVRLDVSELVTFCAERSRKLGAHVAAERRIEHIHSDFSAAGEHCDQIIAVGAHIDDALGHILDICVGELAELFRIALR